MQKVLTYSTKMVGTLNTQKKNMHFTVEFTKDDIAGAQYKEYKEVPVPVHVALRVLSAMTPAKYFYVYE